MEDAKEPRTGAGPQAQPPASTPAPTPARAAMGPAPAAPPARAETGAVSRDVIVEVDGAAWSVRVLGRGWAGGPPSRAPLLLVGFERLGEGAPERREAWVAAPTLEAMAPMHLEAVWREAVVVGEGWKPAPFFPEIAARGARDG